MHLSRSPVLDSTLALLTEGYGWLPNRWRRRAGALVRVRLMGRQAVGLRGPDAVRWFYDESHVRRHGAVPEPVQGTLFGHRAVQTLDGAAHQTRRAMFRQLLTETAAVDALVHHTTTAWDDAVNSWADKPRIVLFDEAAEVLARGVCAWAGIPLDAAEAKPLAQDLVVMVDGFATLGPRHWRARLARGRREDWLARLVEDVRGGAATVPPGSAVDVAARQRDTDGRLLAPRLAAVELLNIVRPTVAVCWFVAFAAHALHLWPEHRKRLREEPAYARAIAHEVRRFYPFAPFIGGVATQDLSWHGEAIPAGTMVLLDLYGQNHDAALWPDPYTFDPHRFLDQPPARDELVPQGGGDPLTSHRCPGESATVALLDVLASRLAQLDYDVPPQDLTIPFHRIPTRPRSGMVIDNVRPGRSVVPHGTV